MKHRKEEDALYNKFAQVRAEEDARLQSEIKEEWERELEKLASKFESLRAKEDPHTLSRQKVKEREDLERHMTIRRDKRKELTTRKMLEHERLVFQSVIVFLL